MVFTAAGGHCRRGWPDRSRRLTDGSGRVVSVESQVGCVPGMPVDGGVVARTLRLLLGVCLMADRPWWFDFDSVLVVAGLQPTEGDDDDVV